MSEIDIPQLVATLTAARDAYYNEDPILSDAEYDALEDQLRELDPNHAFLKGVGASAPGGWQKATHQAPMGSLHKAQTPEDMIKWVEDRQGKLIQHLRDLGENAHELRSASLVVSEKCDGISISLRYKGGSLVQAITRGDGETGEDITSNVLLMQGVLPEIRGFEGHLRGEIVLKRSDHLNLPEYKNPRNAAAGIAKRQSDPSQCKHLTVLHYQAIRDNGKPIKSKAQEFQLLEALNAPTPNWKVLAANPKDVQALYEEYVTSKREGLDWDIDGLVVEYNSPTYMDLLGDHDGRPRGAVAFKFPHEEQRTTLRDIVWQVGNSGRVTPVAMFDPVNLAGATVSQASLHNERRVSSLKLWKGCMILVSRRNDVIPMVEANLSDQVFLRDL